MGATENRKPGRPKDPELEARRKAQILDTAARVFATYGFANTQVQTIANHLGVGWNTIKDILKRDLSRRFAKPKLKHLRYLAIDEIAVAKGHRYLTVVMDLDSGAVVFVGACSA